MFRRMPIVAISAIAAIALVAAACGAPAPTAPSATPSPTPVASPIPLPVPVPVPDPIARYLVTFQSTWSEQTHPTDWPDNSHYSGLIGGTHDGRVKFWQEGQLASEGMRQMAERGRKSPLDLEVMAAISAGTAQHLLSGADMKISPGVVSLEFEIGVNFPLVTLVTMVAPSPDWFVGVSGLSLLPNGQWADELIATVIPWDAGTDSGNTFEADDLRTLPAEPIHRLLGFPVAVNGLVAPFGTMTFRRVR